MAELFAAFGIDWKLLIAQSVNFLIVFGGLTFFLYRPLMRVLEAREEKIAQGVRDAEEAGVLREKIESEKTTIISSAHAEASQVVERAQEEGKKERSDIVKQAQDRAEHIVKDATAQGEEVKKSLLRESEKEIVKTAVLATEKLLREQS